MNLYILFNRSKYLYSFLLIIVEILSIFVQFPKLLEFVFYVSFILYVEHN